MAGVALGQSDPFADLDPFSEQPSPLAEIRAHLAEGRDPNKPTKSGWNALVVASESGDLAPIDLLLKAGANIDARDNRGRTPLMHDLSNIYVEPQIQALLAAKPHLEIPDEDGNTALFHALGLPFDNSAFRELLDAGATLDAINKRGDDPITFATRLFGIPPLHLAASLGDLEAAKELMTRGAPVEKRAGDGSTPLMAAAMYVPGIFKFVLRTSD